MHRAVRVAVLAVLVTVVFGACTGPAATPSPSTVAASPAGSGSGGVASCAAGPSLDSLHQAQALEDTLPDNVGGRSLITWSVAGRCWIEMLVNGPSDAFLADFEAAMDMGPVDPTGLEYAVAGRSNTVTDPASLVYAATRAKDDAGTALVITLLFGGAGFTSTTDGANLDNYAKRTIGGHEVYAGTAAMLEQSDTQQGSPYLYQTDTAMYLVVADDEAWAEDAISQLP